MAVFTVYKLKYFEKPLKSLKKLVRNFNEIKSQSKVINNLSEISAILKHFFVNYNLRKF